MMKKLTSKKCIALLLAVVMIVTSVPLMMVSSLTYGSYDPAPYWGDGSEYSAINTNFIATYNTDGSVDISFPDAVAQTTYDGSSTKTIEYYIFTLTKITEDGETDAVLYTEKLDADVIRTGSGEYPNHIYYGTGALESLSGYDVSATYDIAIHAVDSDGWMSDKIHTLLSYIPYYDITTDFSPNESWVAREMLLFEAAGSSDVKEGSQSSSGNTSGRDYQVYSGSAINADGMFEETGYEGSSSYHFWINSAYDGTSYGITTMWSRSHYNFKNAEEAWFYVDFSRVDFSQVAFSLTANEKEVTSWRSGADDTDYYSRYGTVFSTKAVNGVNTGTQSGVYIQNADGLWEETTMTDGYLTGLSGYEGFVRIPIEYFVLQENQYITADNIREFEWTQTGSNWMGSWTTADDLTNYKNQHLFLESNGNTVSIDGVACPYTTETMTFVYDNSTEDLTVRKFLVNEAGTPVTEAMIVYERYEKATTKTGVIQTGSTSNRGLGWTLHFGPTSTGTTSMTKSGTAYNIDSSAATKAIEDLVSAGIEVAGWSDESVRKAFEIDQVMFCQYADGATFNDDGSVATDSAVQFPDEGLEAFAGDLGYKVAGYYDRTVEVPKAVANYILQYVGEIPSLEDANALDVISSIIETYIDCFPNCSTVSEAIEYIGNAGYTDAYNRYVSAQDFLSEYFSLDDETRNQTAVEAFEKKVELLPDVDFANYNDEDLKKELEELMAFYKSFNLSHFEILGEDEKDKFIELYNIIMGEEVKTGYSIGAYPFIPFNDFETNYNVGQLSYLYYDDYPAREESMSTDVNNTKNLVTYVTTESINQSAVVSGSAIGFSPADYRPTGDGVFKQSTNYARMDAVISTNGFVDTQTATVRLHGDLTIDTTDEDTTSDTKKFAALSTTYKGENADSWANLPSLNLSAIQLNDTTADGTTATDNTRYGTTSDGTQIKANSFVMYVDFTEVENIAMNVKFILQDSSGNDVNCYFCGGDTSATPTIYILDELGDWTEVVMTASTLDQSSAYGDPGICSITTSGTALEGYKGFIRIPLSMFRIPVNGTLTVDYKILDNELANYTFKQVKVYFWDYDTNNVNIGKEIHIDAMGFTYDPENTARANLATKDAIVNKINSDNGITLQNMDAYFGVKTNDSVEFERLVAEIDPYAGKEAFLEAYNKAIDAYNNLSLYQRSLPEVVNSKNVLTGTDNSSFTYYFLARESGISYDNLMAQEPWVAKYTDTTDDEGNVTETAIDKIIADIDTLSDTAKSYDIEAIYEADEDATILDAYLSSNGGEVDYSALGITDKAQAQEIIDMYEKGYCRLSGTNKAALGSDKITALENAYSAAKRAILIEDYIADMTQFKQSIISIYANGTIETDVKMVDYSNAALKTALDNYDEMSVFAKQILMNTLDSVSGYRNMHSSAEAIYDNSQELTLSSGEVINGGIVIFEDRMQSCANDLSTKISSKTVLDSAMLNEIEYCLGQTESFKPRFAQVDQINIAYHQIADQLPVADITSLDADGNVATTIYLDNDTKTSATASIDLTYIATRLNKSVVLYVQSDLTWTQTSGTAYEDFKYYSYYDVTGSESAGVITAPINNNYTNGDSSTITPYEYQISIDSTTASQVPNGAVYTDTVTFYAVDPDVIAEKTADGTDIATVLADSENVLEQIDVTVQFESTNGTDPMSYEVQIPAIPDVEWGDTNAVDVSYEVVNANLGSNQLSITVSNDGARNDDDTAFVMTNSETGTTYKLDYTTENFGTESFTGTVANGKPSLVPTITVTGWDKVPYGTYSTTLTYTADVN